MKFWLLCLRDCGRESISSTLRKLKRLNLDNKDGYVVSVAIALLIASVLLGWYYLVLQPDSNGYMSISLLDAQKKADDYPEYLVSGVNSTFSVYVNVENHMETEMDTKVYVLVTRDMLSKLPLDSVTPVTTFSDKIADGKSAENIATISINEPGNYSVVFELWIQGSEAEEFEFSKNYCVLKVQVV